MTKNESVKNKFQQKFNLFSELGWTGRILLGIAFIFCAFSFLSPFVFSFLSIKNVGFDNSTGYIGDTIGGLMSPFIGIAGVCLTFLAFYVQFRANQQQIKNFRLELDSNRLENQFYEMLKLHKENVNEISLTKNDGKTIVGKEAFKYFLCELHATYIVVKSFYIRNNKSISGDLPKSYDIFFNGIWDHNELINQLGKQDERFEIYESLYYELGKFKLNWKNESNKDFQIPLELNIYTAMEKLDLLNFDLFIGHSHQLGHYYRHLFQMVKYIANRPEDDNFTYEMKRNYLRILRAQLSNQEQELLFYNWKSGYGNAWEDETNKFFTDYRMIHNIPQKLLLKDFILEEIDAFKIESYRKEAGKEDKDLLFEFQEKNNRNKLIENGSC